MAKEKPVKKKVTAMEANLLEQLRTHPQMLERMERRAGGKSTRTPFTV